MTKNCSFAKPRPVVETLHLPVPTARLVKPDCTYYQRRSSTPSGQINDECKTLTWIRARSEKVQERPIRLTATSASRAARRPAERGMPVGALPHPTSCSPWRMPRGSSPLP